MYGSDWFKVPGNKKRHTRNELELKAQARERDNGFFYARDFRIEREEEEDYDLD